MKQILIVNKAKALNAGLSYGTDSHSSDKVVTDLSGLQEGAITFFELGADYALAAPATKNFGIALGRANGQLPFIIPEVDINTLTITKATPNPGNQFTATINLNSTTAGKHYTFRFCKKGVMHNERSVWTVDIIAKTNNAGSTYYETVALINAIKSKINNNFNFTVTNLNNGKLTITSNDWTDWTISALDDAESAMITSQTAMTPRVGDKKYVEDLASKCAAGKGFEDTFAYGATTIPGYPEKVEDLVPALSADNPPVPTEGYAIFTLRFKVGRDSSKTRDEKVWQLVHIAVPVSGTSSLYSNISSILPEGEFFSKVNIDTAIAGLDTRVTALETAAETANAGGGGTNSGTGTGG